MHLLLLQLFLVRFHHKYFASALSPFFSSSLQCFNPIIASFIKNTMIYITLLGDIMRLGCKCCSTSTNGGFFRQHSFLFYNLHSYLLSLHILYFNSSHFYQKSFAIYHTFG